jgi:hypothetical protein
MAKVLFSLSKFAGFYVDTIEDKKMERPPLA